MTPPLSRVNTPRISSLYYDTHKLQQYKIPDYQYIDELQCITCRGFGFIKFTDPESVDKVLSSPTHIIDEKKVE